MSDDDGTAPKSAHPALLRSLGAVAKRRRLALMQRNFQTTAFCEVEQALRRELGPNAGALLIGMELSPVASASVGQVHRETLAGGQRLAEKVLPSTHRRSHPRRFPWGECGEGAGIRAPLGPTAPRR